MNLLMKRTLTAALMFGAAFVVCDITAAETENVMTAVSLDEADRSGWADAVAPLDRPGKAMRRTTGRISRSVREAASINLSGQWLMAPDVDGEADWEDAVTARVPGSIHTALTEAGRIPDPMTGMNDSIALANSYRGWWLRRRFDYDRSWEKVTLRFDGVANQCAVWLNGVRVADHEGMFGGPEADVTALLRRGENELTVKLEPVPNIATGMTGLDRDSWRNSVVINCVYGWHYAKIMPLGIWRGVSLREERGVRIVDPFVMTRSLDGKMRLAAGLGEGARRGKVTLAVTPRMEGGKTQTFEYSFDSPADSLLLDFDIENPQPWWPNDMGEQTLYDADILLTTPEGSDRRRMTFGIRTIEMEPGPDGPAPDRYNWTMKVNGREVFSKGTNWCTVDALLRFDRERYRRMLTAAKDQHLQILRAWGGGAPETDDFYELCDSLGLMVFQEWPTAWNSHDEQPYDILEETVKGNTLRLRNHPSLAMWGGGNESTHPFGKAIDMMGRAAVELDGTRPFHRGEPWGGSRHDYGCWWGDQHLNHNLNMTASFWGEYGIPSMPSRESVDRYLEGEEYSWPVGNGTRLNHHMPVFGGVGELAKAAQLCGYFFEPDSLDDFILGTQLAQTVGGCSVVERARSMWPRCSGVWYYKLNDVYPGLSWSSVDYYGCRKPYHYFLRRSMAPETTVILFDRTNLSAQEVTLPHFLIDDYGRLQGRQVTVSTKVYNYHMHPVFESDTTLVPSGAVTALEPLRLSGQMTDSDLLLFKTDLLDSEGRLLARNWYFTNYETRRGLITNFPGHVRSASFLQWHREGNRLTVTNTASFPSVGVTVTSPGNEAVLSLSDNYLWLDPGETVTLDIDLPADAPLAVTPWN